MLNLSLTLVHRLSWGGTSGLDVTPATIGGEGGRVVGL